MYNSKPQNFAESVVSRFLSKTKASDKNRAWLDQCRAVFRKTMSSSPAVLKNGLLADLLDKAVIAQARMPEEKTFPNSSIKGVVFFLLYTSMKFEQPY